MIRYNFFQNSPKRTLLKTQKQRLFFLCSFCGNEWVYPKQFTRPCSKSTHLAHRNNSYESICTYDMICMKPIVKRITLILAVMTFGYWKARYMASQELLFNLIASKHTRFSHQVPDGHCRCYQSVRQIKWNSFHGIIYNHCNNVLNDRNFLEWCKNGTQGPCEGKVRLHLASEWWRALDRKIVNSPDFHDGS